MLQLPALNGSKSAENAMVDFLVGTKPVQRCEGMQCNCMSGGVHPSGLGARRELVTNDVAMQCSATRACAHLSGMLRACLK